MSVIIVGIDMPKYCNNCHFVYDSFEYCSLEHRKIEDYDFWSSENERPKWCPLKPVNTEEKESEKTE